MISFILGAGVGGMIVFIVMALFTVSKREENDYE